MKLGYKPKISVLENSVILQEINKRRTSLSKIKNDLNLDVINKIIRRILNKSPNVMYVKIQRKQ